MSLSSAKRIVHDISLLKIQGAVEIAMHALSALAEVAQSDQSRSSKEFVCEMVKAALMLTSARPTEPLLANSILAAMHSVNKELPVAKIIQEITSKIREIKQAIIKDNLYIQGLICRKVPDNGIVFTHCHSSTVISGLIQAHKQGIRFTVHNTETRPLYQGRITACQLAKAGIPVTHWVDSGGYSAIRQSDIVFFGCDAIYTDGIANKIGTAIFCETSKAHGVPTYVCAHSMKFDPRSLEGERIIEERPANEVWTKPPKKVVVMNPAFDIISPDSVDALLTELGVLSHSTLINQIREKYPWLFVEYHR